MDDPAVTNALYWLSWMLPLTRIAAGLVAVGVVLEFTEGWMSEPWRKIVDDARTTEIAQLTAEAARLTTEAEQLRQKNLTLEEAVSPRIFEESVPGSKLRQFSDFSVAVISPSDFEPKRAAGQIRFMLRQVAGWQRFEPPNPGRFPILDGIVVHGTTGAGSGRNSEAKEALVAGTRWPVETAVNASAVCRPPGRWVLTRGRSPRGWRVRASSRGAASRAAALQILGVIPQSFWLFTL